jgi:hypothetical protein
LVRSLIRGLRYMCVVMGRPTAINDDDISQLYPAPFDTGHDDYGTKEALIIPGVVAHIKWDSWLRTW